MFKRTNQSVLAPHYTDLVARDDVATGSDDAEDDFITLTRADHDIVEAELPESTHVSKRKMRQGVSKKAMAGLRGSGNKVIFDDETGEANHLHAVVPESSFAREKAGEEGAAFVDKERLAMKEADEADKATAKEKKREKKRKRKARDRGEVRCCSLTRNHSDTKHRLTKTWPERRCLTGTTMATSRLFSISSLAMAMDQQTKRHLPNNHESGEGNEKQKREEERKTSRTSRCKRCRADGNTCTSLNGDALTYTSGLYRIAMPTKYTAKLWYLESTSPPPLFPRSSGSGGHCEASLASRHLPP